MRYMENESNNEQNVGAKAGRVAVAAALATTLSTAVIDPADVPLPEPTPIVQVLDLSPAPDTPVDVVDDQTHSKKHLVLKIMALILALLVIAGAVLGGAATCSGQLLLPVPTDQSAEATSTSDSGNSSNE